VRFVFTTFVKQYRPLSSVLAERVAPLDMALTKPTTVAALDEFVADGLEPIMRDVRVPTPELGDPRAIPAKEQDWARTQDGGRVRVSRHYVAFEVRGDAELLSCWPDESDDLEPVDSPAWPAAGLTIDNRDEIWMLELVHEDARPGVWGLYTYFDLTPDEEAAVDAGEIDLVSIVAERRARVDPIVARIREQVDEFYNTTLPQRVTDIVANKRKEFAAREGVTASLRFPQEWKLLPLRLEDATTDVAARTAQATQDLVVPFTPRLAAVSFRDLQRTIRLWTDAVERYPRSFGVLGEDRISDLLAATLNATMPGAHREVYSRGGKSDIFVHADVLAEGSGAARVFIAEAKWATDDKTVREALDPQLFGYLTATDTAAVLLLLLDQQGRDTAIARYSQVLAGVIGFVREEKSAVDGWPIYVYEHEYRTVRVCLAWVSLPETTKDKR